MELCTKADKGSHSHQVLTDLAALDLRSYIAKPDRGRRHWTKQAMARTAVYANRRRIRGARGRAVLRRRSEYLERPNAHLYETGGLRRTHLRGHANILKRLLVHTGAFNLGRLNPDPDRGGPAARPPRPPGGGPDARRRAVDPLRRLRARPWDATRRSRVRLHSASAVPTAPRPRVRMGGLTTGC